MQRRFPHLVGFAGLMFVVAAAWVADASSDVQSPSAEPQNAIVANPDFQEGDSSPAHWTLSEGQGRWVDRNILEVTGDSKGMNYWRSDVALTPGGLYRFQIRARSLDSCTSIFGLSYANYDQPLSDQWSWYDFVFRASDHLKNDFVRIGQWHAGGSLQFDAVRIAPVVPLYKPVGNLELGDGESIVAGRYSFSGTFARSGGSFHRPLFENTAHFNTNRWCFSGDSSVTYRFSLPNLPFRSGSVQFSIGYYSSGTCIAEVSRDRKEWRVVATRNSSGTGVGELPADLLPADQIFLRLRPAEKNCGFQIEQIGFSANLEGNAPEGRGQTAFADITDHDQKLSIERITIDDSQGLHRPIVRATLKNHKANGPIALFSHVALSQRGRSDAPTASEFTQVGNSQNIATDQSATFEAPIPIEKCGSCDIRLSFRTPQGESLLVTVPWNLPEYYRTDYGSRIEGLPESADVWWCDSTWKVARQRETPKATSKAAAMSAARNDREAVQIVLRPKNGLKQLSAAAGELRNAAGDVIPPQQIQILRVYYHFVNEPTDKVGVRDWWPDALPPLDKPLDVPAGLNQPLWILVHIPTDAKPGDYAGSVSLKAEGWSAEVPVKLHVWNFALPERNHIETAFGANAGQVNLYHRLNTGEQQRQVWDMYMQCLADHRICPYNPIPYDPLRVSFHPEANPPKAEVDFSMFDVGMKRAIEKYHITNFQLYVQGMGGGNFESRANPTLEKFGEDTPQYQAMFSSQLQQMESHLRDKGWLDMAYTYWFDEPEPKDYSFVEAGMDRIKKYAPGIQTMITKHELEGEKKGRIDIWCPISNCYNHAIAEKHRAQGERYWWYVCCGPKEPFCTLFIDHPAVDLRTWLWQTWQRNIVGILVWETTYWRSRSESAQNLYEDPMSYVAGSYPSDDKCWGNGDGRFLYPPLAAAIPGMSGPEPVIAPPVSCIRLEMLREGIEDYEFLWLLRDLIAKKRSTLSDDEVKRYESLLDVPDEITSDITTFSTDPQPIYARRAAIAEAIERLSR